MASRRTPKGTPCLEQLCWVEATDEGRCRQHFLEHKAATAPWAFNIEAKRDLPSDWAARRKKVLERDRYICYICGGPGADSVDHITPRWLQRGNADSHDYSNLKAAHFDVAPYCHRNKSSQEGAQAALEAKRRQSLAQQAGKVIETATGAKTVLKLPRVTVEAILRKYDGMCHVCNGAGADYVEKVTPGAPTQANLKPVHIRVEPRCYYIKGE